MSEAETCLPKMYSGLRVPSSLWYSLEEGRFLLMAEWAKWVAFAKDHTLPLCGPTQPYPNLRGHLPIVSSNQETVPRMSPS